VGSACGILSLVIIIAVSFYLFKKFHRLEEEVIIGNNEHVAELKQFGTAVPISAASTISGTNSSINEKPNRINQIL